MRHYLRDGPKERGARPRFTVPLEPGSRETVMLVVIRRFNPLVLVALVSLGVASPILGQMTNPNFRLPGALPPAPMPQATTTATIGQDKATIPPYTSPYAVPYSPSPVITPTYGGSTATIT